MLFTKRNELTVAEGQIKQDVFFADGTAAVRVNLKFPDFKCKKANKLSLFAAPFYKSVSNAILEYSENDFKKAAFKNYSESKESFIPYSAVMHWENSFESTEYISIILEVSFSYGDKKSKERSFQVWSKRDGKKCLYTDFLTKDKIKEITSKLQKDQLKRFNKNAFALRDGYLEFFIKNSEDYTSVRVDIN